MNEEFLERMLLTTGHPDYSAYASPGIIADTDPATYPSALAVSVSDLVLNVAPGIAVTPSGHRVWLSSTVVGIAPASVDAEAQNVVTIKHYTIDGGNQYNPYGSPVASQRVRPAESARIVCYTITQWTALEAAIKDDSVPLAVVSVQVSSTGSKTLVVTHSRSSYTWLRPWFSPVDIRHRTAVGSGTVSNTNPHGNSLNDFQVGDWLIPALTRHIGVVIAREGLPGIPGTLCTTSVLAGSILTDDGSGTVTGVPGSKYIRLDYYPVALGSVVGDPSDVEFAFAILPRTNIIYQPSGVYVVPASTNLTVRAVRVTALEPPATVSPTQFVAATPGTGEAVIANGKIYVTDSALTLTDTLGDVGPIPMAYRLFLANAAIVKNPQVLICRTKLSDMATGITPTITPLGPGRVIVALDGAAAGPTLDVRIRVTGIDDATGASGSELLTFDSTWSAPPSLPYAATWEAQFKKTSIRFRSVTSVSLELATNAGASAAMAAWVHMDPAYVPALAYSCPAAAIQWDGTRISALHDMRPVRYDLRYDNANLIAIDNLVHSPILSEPAGSRSFAYLEDFRRPQYDSQRDLEAMIVAGESPTGTFQVELSPGRSRLADGADRSYMTRALMLPSGIATIRVVLSSTSPSDRRPPLIPGVWVQLQDGVSGGWGSWVQMTSYAYGLYSTATSLTGKTAARFWVAVANTVRIETAGWALDAMAVLLWT
jgi:hypothetical protein